MLKGYLKALLESLLISIVLVFIGGAIWYLMRDSGISFKDTLFWIAVAPIVFFSMGQIGNNAEQYDPSYLKSKSLIRKSPVAESMRNMSGSRFDLKVIAAGVIVLVFALII